MSTYRDYTDGRDWNWAKDKLNKELEREALEEPDESTEGERTLKSTVDTIITTAC